MEGICLTPNFTCACTCTVYTCTCTCTMYMKQHRIVQLTDESSDNCWANSAATSLSEAAVDTSGGTRSGGGVAPPPRGGGGPTGATPCPGTTSISAGMELKTKSPAPGVTGPS